MQGSLVLHYPGASVVQQGIHCIDTRCACVSQWILDSTGPSSERKAAKEKSGEVLKRLGHKDLKLNEYEGPGGSLFVIGSS